MRVGQVHTYSACCPPPHCVAALNSLRAACQRTLRCGRRQTSFERSPGPLPPSCRYEQERDLRQQMQQLHEQQQLEQQQQRQRAVPGAPSRLNGSPATERAAALREAAAAAAAIQGLGKSQPQSPQHGRQHGPQLAPSLSVRSAVANASAAAHAQPVPPTQRRHTAPALVTGEGSPLGSPHLLDQLSSTASRLEALRQELERDLHAGHADDGSLALSRLQHMLQACSLLRDASAAAASGSRGGDGEGDDAELGSPSSCGEEEQEVALHDDGAAGVGATAAAAVSVALAQSWAAAAGARQASFRHAAAAEGVVRPGKARFKLVAAVPRSYKKHERSLHGVSGRGRACCLLPGAGAGAAVSAFPPSV